MYLNQFGFQEKPFHITPNPRFIFLSKNHKDAFGHLLYGIQQRVGFLSLTGEVGTGKTTVLRTLLGQLGDEDYCLALILNPCLSALELMETIHREFSIPSSEGQNLGQLHDSLNRFLLEQRENGKTVVLVVDEAQNLEPSVLEQLRLLSNLETETDKLIQMVLVGQPELEELFDRPDLRQLRQRLVVRYRLMPMDAEDSEAYIRHRLKVAGWKGGRLFNAKALQAVYRLTGGTPRMINILCDRALLVAYSQDLDEIDGRVIRVAQSELSQVEEPVKRSFFSQLALVLLFLLFILTSLGLLWPRLSEHLLSFSREPLTAQVVPQLRSEPQALSQTPEPISIVTPQRIDELQQKIFKVNTELAKKQAVSVLLQAWGRNVQVLDDILVPETVFREQDLLVSRFQGDLDGLLSFGTPALMEMVLPTVVGAHYFALLGARDREVLIEPGLTETGWIEKSELEKIWFGKAFIPWINLDNIPYLMEPGVEVPGVARLQYLLKGLGFKDIIANGVFDEETIRSVASLQRQNLLIPDGRVGPQTLLLIYRLAGYDLPGLVGGDSL